MHDLESGPVQRTVLRFQGPYRGAEVAWVVVVATLAYWRRRPPGPAVAAATGRSFIQVTGRVGPRLFARVGLPLEALDDAALHKTRIMLTQWKRIGPGLHPFGAAPSPTA